jgi:hypothetical protein
MITAARVCRSCSSSFGGCLNVYVDPLCASSSENSVPENEEQHENYDDENRDDRDYASTPTTPTTIIIVSHDAAPSVTLPAIVRGDQLSEGDLPQLLPQGTGAVNHDVNASNL